MKYATINIKTLLVTLALSVFFPTAYSQQKEAATVKQLLESKHYTFVAEYVFPQGGSQRLISNYSLTVAGDSLVADLPYFGRAYSAPIDPSKAGINFTSTDFSYAITAGKNKWDIEMKPRDDQQTEALDLTVFDNGKASLMVTSQFRQSISFSGYLRKE